MNTPLRVGEGSRTESMPDYESAVLGVSIILIGEQLILNGREVTPSELRALEDALFVARIRRDGNERRRKLQSRRSTTSNGGTENE